jgi:phenylacetaldehyde dehydrogenase
MSDAQAFLGRTHGLWIDGKFVEASGGSIGVIDPATANEVARIGDATTADVDRAVASARRALEGDWAKMSPAGREALLWTLADALESHADELAELESIDNGKTKIMARLGDMAMARDYLRYMAGWATKISGQTLDVSIGMLPGAEYHAYTARRPVGVAGQIVPWNFPLLMAVWKLAPALAAGCTCVLKPAEQTSLTALRFAEIAQAAGLPDGVLNVITGYGHISGAALVAHEGIDKVAFTGSTEVGKLINKSATDTMKRVTLELGGKSPMIVLGDMDPATAAGGSAGGIFFNSGQVCTAASRLYVHADIYDEVLAGVVAAANTIKLGSGLDPATQMGPVVSAEQQARVLDYVDSARREGGAIVTGGEAGEGPGYFVKPTVIAEVNPDMKVVREEIFGPVLVAQRFHDLDQVAKAANDTAYGLGASIWSNDLKAVHRLVPKIKAGTIWVNCHNFVDPNVPFGGFKQSGIGREHGSSAIEAYTELQSVIMAV